MCRARPAGVGWLNTVSVGSSIPSHSSSSTMKNTEAAESMPRRANLALGSMRSAGVLNDLARYATHQSRISSSVGYDFTNYFVPRGGFASSPRVARFREQRQMVAIRHHGTTLALECARMRILGSGCKGAPSCPDLVPVWAAGAVRLESEPIR